MDIAKRILAGICSVLLADFSLPAEQVEISDEVSLPSMQPADILTSDKNLQSLIFFPDVGDDASVYIRCEANINTLGGFEDSFCYNESGIERDYGEAVLHAVTIANAIPATINDRKVMVWMPFSVVFQQDENGRKISVFPNHLIYLEEYGADYTAPQRYSIGIRGYACRQRQRGPVRILQEVGSDGLVKQVTILGTGFSVRCSGALERQASGFKYIPAMLDGNFVHGSIDEYFFSLVDVH